MTVTLCDTPYRHYKVLNPTTGKVTWTGADGQRIQSVTDLLNPDQGALMNWAVGRTVVAAEQALSTFLPETSATLARSVLDFPGLMALTGEMPDDVRDAKADLGTEAHHYLALRLTDYNSPLSACRVDYGYQLAIDDFIESCAPVPVVDEHGPRVERAVGSFMRALAGTYDAQVWMHGHGGNKFVGARHRIDLKSSNRVYGKALAQLAAYEYLVTRYHGEQPSDFLTVVHITPMGEAHPISVAVGSDEHRAALELFEAHVTIRRTGARLDKIANG